MSTFYTKPDLGEVIDAEQLMRAVGAAGNSFFSKANMKGFRSKIYPEIFVVSDGWLFITSERGDNEAREYTVRKMTAGYQIVDVSKFGQFKSKRQAMSCIAGYLKDQKLVQKMASAAGITL